MPIALLVLLLGLMLALKSFGTNREYERAALFRLGRLGTSKEPG